jgi:hypothetical protein
MMICKALIVQPLSFKASKKSFHHRIISAVTTPTHTLSNAFARSGGKCRELPLFLQLQIFQMV